MTIKSLLKGLDRLTFAPLIAKYACTTELERKIARSCRSVLDVGCGTNSPLGRFVQRVEYSVGVNAFGPALIQSRNARIHDDYRLMDVRDLEDAFQEKSFDCVLASDVMEHLTKEDGLKLVDAMERIARKKVVIFTPKGFLPQDAYSGNPMQRHLSGWTVFRLGGDMHEIEAVTGSNDTCHWSSTTSY